MGTTNKVKCGLGFGTSASKKKRPFIIWAVAFPSSISILKCIYSNCSGSTTAKCYLSSCGKQNQKKKKPLSKYLSGQCPSRSHILFR